MCGWFTGCQCGAGWRAEKMHKRHEDQQLLWMVLQLVWPLPLPLLLHEGESTAAGGSSSNGCSGTKLLLLLAEHGGQPHRGLVHSVGL